MLQMDIRQVIPKKRYLKEKNILLRKTVNRKKKFLNMSIHLSSIHLVMKSMSDIDLCGLFWGLSPIWLRCCHRLDDGIRGVALCSTTHQISVF